MEEETNNNNGSQQTIIAGTINGPISMTRRDMKNDDIIV